MTHVSGDVVTIKRKTESLSVNVIHEPKFSIRVEYDRERLHELSQSLVSQGVIAPVLVTDIGDGQYEIHAGTRRLRAAKMAGLKEIPATIIDLDGPVELILLALAENLQREDLDPFEEARAFLRLIRGHGMSLAKVARRINKPTHYVRRRLDILMVPERVQDLIAEGKLGLVQLDVIRSIPTGEDQVYFSEKAVENKFTSAELRKVVQKKFGVSSGPPSTSFTPEKVVAKVELLKDWARRLPSRVKPDYFSAEERDRVTRALQELEEVVHSTKEYLISPKKKSAESAVNEGQEWTVRDVEAINASDRPSDEILAEQLGRTTGAIRSMRTKTRK